MRPHRGVSTAAARYNPGMGAQERMIERVPVGTDEEARRLRVPGSPTIRVDGRDLFPGAEGGEGGLRCRVYATPEGMAGAPTEGMIARALRETRGWGVSRPAREGDAP